MQRVHYSDLAGHVLAQGGYDHLCLPAEYDGVQRTTTIGWTDPRRASGELLWPQQFGAEQLTELKLRLGSYAAAAQLQQRPSPAEGGILKRGWWKYYLDLKTTEFDVFIQSWDLAFKGEQNSSYVVGQVWGRSGPHFVLLDQVRAKLNFPETIETFLELGKRWPQCTAKFVEDKANGPALIATLQREIPGIIAVRPDGTKEARAHAISALIQSGSVFLPDKSIAPWIDDFVEECAAFPKGAYDDQVDCCTQALKHLYQGWQQEQHCLLFYEERVRISPF